MKTFKVAECWVHLAAIISCSTGIIAGSLDFIMGYFIVGSLQFTGMLVHEYTGSFTAKGSIRRIYQRVVYVLVGCMVLTPLVQVTGIVFWLLLYAAPLLACLYTVICFRETYQQMRRPLSVLK